MAIGSSAFTQLDSPGDVDAHHQWRLAAYALEAPPVLHLGNPAAHYHIQGPLLWRLAGSAQPTKGLLSCEWPLSSLYAFVILLIPGQQSRTNCPIPGQPGHNCRGLPRSRWGWCVKPRTASVRCRQKPHPQVGVTSGCEPSWPHASQLDTRPGGFCRCLTARRPMICMVAGLIAPTIHQSHGELVNIVSSSGGLAIMQTATSQVASTCRLRLGSNSRRHPLPGKPGGFNMVDKQLSEACKKSLVLESMEKGLNRVTTPFTQSEMETLDHVGLASRGRTASLGVVGTALHATCTGLPTFLPKTAAQ